MPPRSLVGRAEDELRRAGWFDAGGAGSEVAATVMRLVRTFARQGQTGESAAMTVRLFGKLACGEPLTALTYEDAEWEDRSDQVGYPLWQNLRDVRVFRHGPREAPWSAGSGGPLPTHDGAACRWCRS